MTGLNTVVKATSGGANSIATRSLRCKAADLGNSSPNTMCNVVEMMKASPNENGVSHRSGTPSAVNSGCERCSMAGSAMKPISRLIMLTPSCTAAMYWSRWVSTCCTVRGRRRAVLSQLVDAGAPHTDQRIFDGHKKPVEQHQYDQGTDSNPIIHLCGAPSASADTGTKTPDVSAVACVLNRSFRFAGHPLRATTTGRFVHLRRSIARDRRCLSDMR